MQTKATVRTVCIGVVGASACAAIIVGCSNAQRYEQGNVQPTSPGMLSPQEASGDTPNGAQLWAENCIRCHNYRAPASLNDRQWEIAMHHMRVRANLTANEHRLILQFLQAAN